MLKRAQSLVPSSVVSSVISSATVIIQPLQPSSVLSRVVTLAVKWALRKTKPIVNHNNSLTIVLTK
jgi:hypothetical protein